MGAVLLVSAHLVYAILIIVLLRVLARRRPHLVPLARAEPRPAPAIKDGPARAPALRPGQTGHAMADTETATGNPDGGHGGGRT